MSSHTNDLTAPGASADPYDGETNETSAVQSIPASILLTLLSVVTAVGFCRIFVGWEFLGPMLFIVIAVHAVCFVLRLRRVPGYVAVPAAFVVLICLLAWKYYPTTLNGPFPTTRTWHLYFADLRLARGQFPSAVAPVAAVGGFAVLATASTAVAAILSDAFAFRAYGRVETTVPTAVLLVFASALGADRNRVAVTAAWLACALGVIAILRVMHAQVEHAWIGPRSRVLVRVLPAIALLAGCAAAGGAWLGPRLPGAGEKGLINTSGHREVTQVLSPLVDIRSRLVSLSNTELFTVASDEPNYWRATALTIFDGSTWKLPDGDLTSVSGAFAGAPQNSHEVVQQIHIASLGGSLLPAAYSPVRVDDGTVYWVNETGTLVVPKSGLQRAANYTIVSAVVDIAAADLANSTSVNAPAGMTELPSDFPNSVREAALAVTANASTMYEKSLALQNWFRTGFTYDLTVQRGHSNDALENFLRIRRGYCEQFSGAFASMARSLGIPARVAVGFTPGDFQDDDRYHVFGRNAHAWPEVWFDSVGWVSFEPTPGRGQPGGEAHTGVQPQQAQVDNPGNAGPVVTPSPTTNPGSDVTTTTESDTPTRATTTTIVGAGGAITKSSLGGGPPWLAIIGLIVLAMVLWAIAMPFVLRQRRKRHRAPDVAEDIRRSWQRSTQALALLGVALYPTETPLEHANRAGRVSGVDGRILHELANQCTAAVYGGIGDDDKATRCAELSAEVVQAVKERLGTRERMMAAFNPRLASLLLKP